MTPMLALHTWTLDSTSLPDFLRITRAAGWDGVELRRVDFARAAEKGQPAAEVLRLVKASGLRVACVGVEMGWIFADDSERRRLLQAFAESCRWAAELGCSTVMSASDRGRGDLARAAANVREAGDIAAAHRVKLAIEFNSQAEQLNNLDVMRGAALYLMLGAEFLAAAQVIVYAGAIMVLFVFAIMVLIPGKEESGPDPRRGARLLAVPVGALLCLLLVFVVAGQWSGPRGPGAPSGSVAAVGRLLFTSYLFPFELTSVLLLAAMVGVLLLAKRRA
jgi:NADH-quinone oxidoreductase subunit J